MIEADREKLIKILRMFSSHHDGEIVSAARRAHELITSRALDWDDLIVSDQPAKQNKYRPEQTGSDVALIRRCMELEIALSAWEREFLTSISQSILEWGKLTPKQKAILDRIVTKLQLRGIWEEPE